MKPLNANSLRNALAPQAASSHPEPDLLNAFAEGLLPADERRRVLNHLSGCEECRAVVALASDAAPVEAVGVAWVRSRRPIFRIAIPAFAAAAALVATVLVLHHAPRDAQQNASVALQAPAPPATSPSDVAISASPTASIAADKKSQPAAPAARARIAAPLAPPSAAQPAPAAAQPAPAAPAPAPLTTAQAEIAPAPSQQTIDAHAEIPAPLASGGTRLHGAGSVANAPSSAFANNTTTRALAKAAATPMARPHWRISRQGQAERAFGDGPWQAVLPADAPPMRVLATAGADVWIGGDNAQLYHSSDEGQTWIRTALPEKNGAVHSIAHIQIDSPIEITVRAADGTSWTTSNGGASWK
ncbi:MAG TPA: zf-HC2 domain-containing protein [Terracidiphilus sp.]